ncbi:TolC family protein, partial [bacterium]|nr:TolC family protein [bacterium]
AASPAGAGDAASARPSSPPPEPAAAPAPVAAAASGTGVGAETPDAAAGRSRFDSPPSVRRGGVPPGYTPYPVRPARESSPAVRPQRPVPEAPPPGDVGEVIAADRERDEGPRRGRKGEAPERIGLGECVRRAVDRAPEVEVARGQVAVSQARLAEVEAKRFLPEAEAVDLFGLARRAEGTVLDPLDTVNTHAYGVFTKVEVNMVQPIFTWGKITAGIEAATHAVEAQLAASRGVAAEVSEQVKSLYYNVLLARSVQGIIEEVNDAFTSALETAQRRRAEGDPDVTELGILYLRVGQAQSAKELPRIRRGSENALLALRRAIAEPEGSRVDVKERRLRPEKAELEPLEAYAERLFLNNPAWRQLDAGMAAKAQEIRTVEADYFPMFFVTGNFRYGYAPRRDRQLNPFAYDTFNILEGPGGVLGVRWPLNFHVTAARANTARAELGLLEARRRQAATGLPLELKTAYDRVVDTGTAVEKAEVGRRSARAILTLAVTNFDVGIGEPREIIEALATYSRVSTEYYETVRDHNMALAGLSRILGEEVADLDETAQVVPPLAAAPADASVVQAEADRRAAAALASLARQMDTAAAAVGAAPARGAAPDAGAP